MLIGRQAVATQNPPIGLSLRFSFLLAKPTWAALCFVALLLMTGPRWNRESAYCSRGIIQPILYRVQAWSMHPNATKIMYVHDFLFVISRVSAKRYICAGLMIQGFDYVNPVIRLMYLPAGASA